MIDFILSGMKIKYIEGLINEIKKKAKKTVKKP